MRLLYFLPGEIKNPARDAPVALMVALVIVTTVYCLVQVLDTNARGAS